MPIPEKSELTYADVTPKATYMNRRQLLKAMGIAGGAAALGGAAMSRLLIPPPSVYAGAKLNVTVKSPFSTTEKINKYDDVAHYNNFYEFGTDKSDPARNAGNFRTSPWTVSIEGECKNPRKYSMD